jgi:hypothetical protein
MEQKLEDVTQQYMTLQTKFEAQQREYDAKMAAQRRDAVKRASVEANTAVRVGKVRKAREQRRAGAAGDDDNGDSSPSAGGDMLSRLSRGEKDAGMLHIMQNFKASGITSPLGSGTSTMVGSTSTTTSYATQLGPQSSRRSMAATALSPPSSRQSSMTRQSMLGSAASPTRGVAAAAAIVGAAGSASALSTLSTSISSTLLTLISNSDRPSLLAGTSMSNSYSPSIVDHHHHGSSSAVDLDLDSEDGEHGPFVPSPPRNLAFANSAANMGSSALSSSIASSSRSSDHDDDDGGISSSGSNGNLGGARLSGGSTGGSNVRSGSGSRGSSGSSGPRFMQHTASSQPKSKPPTPASAMPGLLPPGGGRRNSKPGLDLPPGGLPTSASSTPLGQTGHLFRSSSFDDGTENASNPDGSPLTDGNRSSSGAALSDAELLDGPDDEPSSGGGSNSGNEGANANVFDRLLDPSKFTGMHKHIHGDKKLHTRQRSTQPTKGSKDGTTVSSSASVATVSITPPAAVTTPPTDPSGARAPRPGEWRPPIKGSIVAPSSSDVTGKEGNTPRPSLTASNSKDGKPAWIDNPVGVGAIIQDSGTKKYREDGSSGSPTLASSIIGSNAGPPVLDRRESVGNGVPTANVVVAPAAVSSTPTTASTGLAPPDSVYARLSDPRGFTGAHRVKHAAHADRSRRPGSMTQFPSMTELQASTSGGAVTAAAKLAAATTINAPAGTKTSSVKKGPTAKTTRPTAAPTSSSSSTADVPTVKAPSSLFPIKLGGMTITPGPGATALTATGGSSTGGSTTPSSSSQALAAAAAAGGTIVFTPLTPSGNGARQPQVFSFSTSSISTTSQSPPRHDNSNNDNSAHGKENKNPATSTSTSSTGVTTSKDAPSTPPRGDPTTTLQPPLASVGAMSPVPPSSDAKDLWREWNTTFGEGGGSDPLDDGLGE